MIKWVSIVFTFLYFQIEAQKLLQIQVLIRHGARNSIYQRWNLQNDTQADAGLLTAAGVRQHYVLGQLLKQDYIDKHQLISSAPNQTQMTIMSTDVNRTLMSAQSLLIGMFSQNQSEQIPLEIIQNTLPPMPNVTLTDQPQYTLPFGYIPMPIHTKPKEIDFLLLGNENSGCPYVNEIYEQNTQSSDAKYLNQSWEPFVQQLKLQGLNVSNFEEVAQLADDVACNRVNGKGLPNLTDIQFQALEVTRSIYLQFQHYRNYYQTQLQISGLMEKILGNMQNNLQQKFHLYSAHDNNIFNILNILKITNWQCYQQYSEKHFSFIKSTSFQEDLVDYCQQDNKYPDFASNIIFEVWEQQNSTDKFVKFKYNGEYMKICSQRTEECPYDQFFEELQRTIIPNYLDICGSKTSMTELLTTYVQESGYYIFLNLITAMFAFFMIQSLVIGVYYQRKLRTVENNKNKQQLQFEIEL